MIWIETRIFPVDVQSEFNGFACQESHRFAGSLQCASHMFQAQTFCFYMSLSCSVPTFQGLAEEILSKLADVLEEVCFFRNSTQITHGLLIGFSLWFSKLKLICKLMHHRTATGQ